jgi:hypothetical protein
MIDPSRIEAQTLSTEPYRWAFIGELFSPSDAAALVESYPGTVSRPSSAPTARRAGSTKRGA